jgi:prefoldin beta subunit
MVRQDKEEAKDNVDKRLEFIKSELAKVEEAIKLCEEEFEKKRQELITVQTEIQQSSAVVAK